MLHIHNGDSTAGTLKESGFPGEHKAFQEVLMEGPTPGGILPDEFLQARARFLAEAYELKLEEAEQNLREQEIWLRKFSEHAETILWFEHDLFCQINLVYLLDWFSRQSTNDRKLSLICIGEFPGVDDFRGLGQLSGERLASLFKDRHEVSEPELILASKAWAAYRSSNPKDVLRLIESDTSAMPFLESALRLHLSRFPSEKNGLGRIERKALNLVATGIVRFSSLFSQFSSDEPNYGLGDSQFWSVLRALGNAKEPLIRVNGMHVQKTGIKSTRYHTASLELTDFGRAVLAAERDFIEVNGIDRWLGGVRLVGSKVWRWDEGRGTVTFQ
jgi:hypothetical protein